MGSNFEIVVYYISNRELCIQELQIYHKNLCVIEVIFHKNDGTMSVLDLQSTVPGKEYGTHLIIKACNEAEKRDISIVTLDDCSNRYRKSHNIYTKLGMTYEEDWGPEMTGSTKKIANLKTHTDTPKIYSLSL